MKAHSLPLPLPEFWHAELSRYAEVWIDRADIPVTPMERVSQREMIREFLSLIESRSNYCDRDCLPGHLTGSAFLVTADRNRVCLTLHRKLNRWLQLGGHADGDPRIDQVALREAREESGINEIDFFRWESMTATALAPRPLFFDLDIHSIPARPNEAAHLHFDLRYLVIASSEDRLQRSDESADLRWFTLEEAKKITSEPSMQRQFAKWQWLRSQL